MLKYNYKPSDNVFFTSDTHFSHANIIKYCERPFNDIEEMNETIIRNWNETVPENGIVFHLGDFAFGTIAQWEEIRAHLNGEIHLILGNHDYHTYSENKERVEAMFSSVSQQISIELGNRKIWMNHYPFLAFAGTYRTKNPAWQLFGHVHLKPCSKGADSTRMLQCFPVQYDVGVDLNGFKPISFWELSKRIQYQRDHNTNVMHWISNEDEPV